MSTTHTVHVRTESEADTSLPQIPGYALLRVLGRGGMGCVYLARDLQLGREVAIKTLLHGADVEQAARFHEEVTAVAAIRHPNVLQVHHAGEFDGQPYMVMEYVEGGTLRDGLGGKPVSPTDAATLLVPIARAIQHCHELGVLHRDLKPGNILLSSRIDRPSLAEDAETVRTHVAPGHHTCQAVPKVADFGLVKRVHEDAHLTRTGQVLGTPAYMAPEQASGVVAQLGPGVDIYALGAIFYEMLTGRPPFQSPDPVQTMMMVISMDPVSPRQLQPKLQRDIETICLKCLEKSPRKRYDSAGDLADDLDRFLQGRPIQARPVRAWEKGIKWARRRPTLAALVFVSVLATIVILTGSVIYNARLTKANESLETSNRQLEHELDRSQQMFVRGHELVRYLLNDHNTFLTRLKGSTGAQMKLVQELLPYLDHLAKQIEGHEKVAGDVTEPELASAYERLARVQGFPGQVSLGDTSGSRESFKKALAIRENYLKAHPDDILARISLARCYVMLAEVDRVAGDSKIAQVEFHTALQLLESLSKTEDEVQERWQVEHDAHFGLAESLISAGNIGGGLKELKARLPEVRQRAIDRKDDWRTIWNLAQVLSRVGEISAATGDLASAKEHFDEAIGLSITLSNSSRDDVRFQRELGVNFMSYGDLLLDERKMADANKAYEAATNIFRGLVKSDPAGRSIERDLGIALEKWGRGLNMAGKSKEAVPILEEGLTLNRQVVREDPTHLGKRKSVRIALTSLGTVYGEIAKSEAQRKCYVEAAELADIDRDLVSSAEAYLLLAVSFRDDNKNAAPDLRLADLVMATRHFDTALEKFAEITKAGPLTPSQERLKTLTEKLRKEAQASIAELKFGLAGKKKP